MSEPKGRGDAWTEARRRSDEGRQHLKSAPEASGGTLSTWQDLVTASLIGTERTGVPVAGIPGLPAVADETSDAAAVLLDRAALLTAARRAGRRPDRGEPLPVCEPDPRCPVSPAAADRLARMLGGEYPDLLIEWLRAVTARGLRLPPQFLPVLLDRVRRLGPTDTALARPVAEAGGPRAGWLAGLNPDWEFAAAPTPGALTGEDAWRLGDAGQRRGYLASLLARDPDAARDLVRGSWDAAGPAERIMFLSVLADRIGPADEPLLEAALDDRAEDVRGRAAHLLARLPGSALGQRMAERALRCVRMAHDARGTRLVITPPAECDASMRRDGIAPGPAAGRLRLPQRTFLLLEAVTRTPLRAWTSGFGLTAAQVVALRSGEWAPVLFTGWSRAAIAQRDHEWMAALITRALALGPSAGPEELEALRQLARRADPALGAPDALPRPAPDTPPVVGTALRVLRFRYEMLKELDDDHRG
jgi:Family of unknown function (DUF5691)